MKKYFKNKDFIAYLTIFIAVMIAFLLCIIQAEHDITNRKKIRIDSISVHNRYSTIPSKYWVYHTQYGPTLTSNKKIYNIGDSITINEVSINDNN